MNCTYYYNPLANKLVSTIIFSQINPSSFFEENISGKFPRRNGARTFEIKPVPKNGLALVSHGPLSLKSLVGANNCGFGL